jgi:DNA uptake protein ComE-like DNA-binding protein
MSKDYFYFNRTDRIVAIVLLVIIAITCALRVPTDCNEPQDEPEADADTVRVVQKNYTRTYTRDTVRREYREYRKTEKPRSTAGYTPKYERNEPDTLRRDTLKINRYVAKVRPDSPVDLNGADSTLLVTLPGIGPVYASRILRYREQLGGFTGTSQLTELEGLPDSLMEWFIIGDTVPTRRIMVNKASVAELRRHPYLNFYQARAIVEFRSERGRLKGPEQLSLMEEFTARDLERIIPYLDFR